MKLLVDYIEENSTKTFDELPYNELDSLVLSLISYLELDGIVFKNKNDKITFGEAFEKFFKRERNNNYSKYHGIGLLCAYTIASLIRRSKRYKDLLLYYYDYQFHDDLQFSAVCIDINDKLTFISYEGTDDLVAGWREDGELCYKYPTNSQEEAIKYINKAIDLFSCREYIIGGHSKGGNLSLVAAMNANMFARMKIKKVYSFDGPGLKLTELESNEYKRIKDKYELIIPEYSIVGIFLRNDGNYRVIKSSKKTALCHDATTWYVEDNHLVDTKLSVFSTKLHDKLTEWLDSYDYEQREFLVNEIFDIFDRLGITDLTEVKANMLPQMRSIIKELPNVDQEAKKMLMEIVKVIISALLHK